MEDNLNALYYGLKANPSIKGLPNDYPTFQTAMKDDATAQSFYYSIKSNTTIKGLPESYDEFSDGLGLKKKDFSGTSVDSSPQSQVVSQGTTPQVNESSTQASPSTSAESVQKTEAFTSPERPQILNDLGLSIETPKPTGFKEDNIGTRGLQYLSGETRDFTEEGRKQLQNKIGVTPSTQVLHPDNIVTGSTPGSLIADFLKGKPIPRDSPKAETLGEKVLSVPHEAANAFGKFFDDIANVGKAAESGFAQLFLGKKGSDEYMKIKEKGGLTLPGAMSTHPAQTLSTLLDKSTENWKQMPDGVGWSVGKGLIDIAPDIASTMLFPEVKVGMMASKYGLKLGSFALEQAARGYAQGIGERDGNFGLQLKMPIVTALEKGAMGWMYETVGGMNRTFATNLAKKLLPNPTTTSEILNKALFEHGTMAFSDGFAFGGLSALDEYLKTGKITADNTAIGFGTGLAFHTLDGAKLMAAKGLNTILSMPSEGITNLAKSEMSIESLNKQADDLIGKLENKTSENPEGDAVMAFMLKQAAQAKNISEIVLNNKDELILNIKSSTLDTKEKNLLIDKINQVHADNDPKIQQTKDITEKIAKIDDALGDISSNKSWDDTRKEVESAPLKERKEELKQEAKKVYGIEPKEQPKGEDGKVKEKPKAVQTELSKKTLDEIDKPAPKAEELPSEQQKADNSTDKPSESTDNSGVYNKQQVIESVISQIPDESKDMMRNELANMSIDDFNEKVAKAGFNNVGSHWVVGTVAKGADYTPKGTNEGNTSDNIPDKVSQDENTANLPQDNGSEPLSPESDSNVPKEPIPPKNTSNTDNNAEKPDQREKSLLNRLKNAVKLSEPFKKHVEEKGLTYEAIPNDVTKGDVDALIAENGTRATESAIFDTTNDMPARVRSLAAVRLITRLDSFADEAAKEGDTKAEYDYRLRSVKMAEFIDNTVRDWGRGIQILASDEVNATLAPKTQVIMSKRAVRRQRDSQQKYYRKDIGKKTDSMRQANKESADEVLNTDAVKKAKDKAQGKEEGEKKKPVAPDKVKIIREKRKVLFDQLKESFKKPSEPLSSSIIGLNKEQVEIIGNIVANYVEEGYYRTQDLTKKLIKDLDKYAGIKLSQEEAEKHINDTFEQKENLPILADKNKQKSLDAKKEKLRKRLEELQKGNFPEKKAPPETDAEIEQLHQEIRDILDEKRKEDNPPKEPPTAGELLANKVDRMLQDPKTPKDDPVKQMVETLFKKVQEKDTKEKVPVEKKTVIDKLRDALQNKDKYASVWEEAKQLVKDKIDTNNALTDEQRQEQHDRVDAFYNEVIGTPFSEGQVGEAVKKEIKDLGVSIDQVVRDHYTVYDATKRTLQEKLIDELGLDGDNAKMIADAVSKEFDKIAIAKKQAILKKGITAKEVVRSKTAKEVWQKLIEDSNLGAFSDSEFAEAYADKWGFPKLTDEQAKDIEVLADKAYKAPESYQKYEAIQDLLKYQTKLPGIDKGQLGMSVWYNFILSGVRTQWKNVLQNSLNATMELGVATARHPSNLPMLVTGAWKGAQKGWSEAGHILKTGYYPIKGGKVEAPSTTELLSNKNVLSLTKYVTRWMVAADMFTYGGLKEMRSYELAMNMARAENESADKPSMSNWKKANEILNHTSEREAEAKVQAEQEGLKGNNAKRRVWEIMEQARPKDMIEDANNFASRGTFNHQTEGILGLMTDGLNSVIQKTEIKATNPLTGKSISVTPLKFIVPFTRIIANVANVALDYYPPVSLIRAATGGMGLESMGSKYREYTKEERQKLLIKASIGIAAQAAIYMLSQKDDKGESQIEITANGTGDFEKNNELKERGWQPYSIRIGKHWYSYQYTPLALTLAPMGLLNDAQKYQPDKAKEETILAQYALANFRNLRTFSDMTWASSVNSLLGTISTGDVNKGGSFMTNLATSTTKGFVYPKLIEQTVQAIDAYQENPRKDAQGFIGKVTRDMPIVRNRYNVMLNAVGEPVKYDLVQMESKVKEDPFWNYVDKHNLTIGKPQAKTPIYDDINKVERGMTDDEYFEFIKKSGQEIKQRITNEVMPKNLSEDDIKKEIVNIKSDVRNKFKTELFGWGQIRQAHPDDWKLLKDNEALQIPKSSEELTIGKEKMRIGEKGGVPSKELEDFNNTAMEEYRKRVVNYLGRTESVTRDKARIIPAKEISVFEEKINTIWSEVLDIAKNKTVKAMREQNKQQAK